MAVYVTILFTLIFFFSKVSRADNQCLELFSDTSYFSQASAPIVKKLVFSEPPRIVTTHYAGTGKFDEAVMIERNQTTEGAFVAGPSKKQISVGFNLDEMIISQQQNFSMATMVTTEYLTPREAKMFRDLGANLQPGQIVFSEVLRNATPEEIRYNYGDSLGIREGGLHTDFTYDISDRIPVKTAALWSVSGQIWDKDTGLAIPTKLPWEKEEARKGQELDREKYKFVYEWGRAAQEVSGEILPLYSINAMNNFIQLRAYHGSLNDAYVMVHSFDPVNTRLYAKMTNNGYYPPNQPINPHDMLFLTTLEWALQSHPPSRVSQKVADIVRLSESALSEVQIMDLLIDNRLRRWMEMDYEKGQNKQEGPIIVNDLSANRFWSVALILQALPIPREAQQKILDYLIDEEGQIILMSSNYRGKYNNAADSVLSSHYYHQRNAIEISNLDLSMAVKDPDYSKSVIKSVYLMQLQRLAEVFHVMYRMSVEECLNLAEQKLREWNIQIGVTTHINLIQKQLGKLYPQSELDLPQSEGAKARNDEVQREHPNRYRASKMYFFSVDQISKWSGPDKTTAPLLSLGRWRAQYLLSQPDIF